MDHMLDMNKSLESHFREIREGVIGNNGFFMSPYGAKKILYAQK